MRRFGEWQAEALTHLYTAIPDAPSDAGTAQFAGAPANLGPRCERTFCSNAACRLRTSTQTCVAEADLHLWSMQEIAKALKANGIPCPDSRDEGAQRLASYLGIPLQPPPPFEVATPTTPANTGPPSIESKDKGPETALPNDQSILPQAPPLPSMTSAERHVWHFCTSCAARVCNACGYRDDGRSKSNGASTSNGGHPGTCSQWQSWAVFHALRRLDFEWDKYPEVYANWPRNKAEKGDVGVGSVEKTVAKRDAERGAGAVWAKGTGYGGDDDRSAFYGSGHYTRHHFVTLKQGELLERSTGDSAIEPVAELLVQSLELSASRDRFGAPIASSPSPDGPFSEPAPLPLGACSLLRQSRPFRRLLQFGLQSHPLGFWNTGTGNPFDFGKGRSALPRHYLMLLRQLAGDAGTRGLLFSDLFTTKAAASTTAGSRLIAALVELNSDVSKSGRSVGRTIRNAFFGRGGGAGSSSVAVAGPSASPDAGGDLTNVIKGTYAYLWGSEEWTDSEAAWKRKQEKDDDSDDEGEGMEEADAGDGAASARRDAEKEAYKAALKPKQFLEAPISSGHYFSRQGASSSSGGGAAALPQHQKHVMKELANLAESLPLEWDSSIHIRVDPHQTHVLKALILAPAETPYANGAFLFDVLLPPNYPAVAPKFQLLTTGGGSVRFNPNLYECGKVCLSLLGTWSGPGWKPFESTLLQVLVSIQSFIFVAEPYYNEPGHELHLQAAMSQQYNANIRRHCLQQAILNQLRKPPPAFADVIAEHFARKRREIEEQCATWIMESDTLVGGDITRVAGELKQEFKTRFGPLPEPGRPGDGLPGRPEPSEERAVKRQNFGK
ncbi:ubiquitin-conjugating enzyme family protein [Klebsormidium nitens]|uniref:Ubiquitin-conjugating enzyme family protein n=1 Tax=Klebsormidium nitens TaxID=105231 RepID=A0A1Y1HQV5_KLENI|nr:ubiquitin-conjugating enzyme family protein [Klebsormidium nitens]|eukprot:GAQ78947.1 ubiquitin-conjugating enzyme family protein [Klebsormidium nitens]